MQLSDSTVTITKEGTYLLSGTLNDGMIIVNTDKSEKVQLVLDSVTIHSETSAAIYVLQSDKVSSHRQQDPPIPFPMVVPLLQLTKITLML